ncbi:MAG: polysaccharide deacetylase family protein, partial [Planctomycetes bacterium]|nr:polysaccharide deacetylase family protein [Planctomycetota bacterium]
VDDVCSQLGEPELLSEVLSWDALRALAKDGVTLGPHTHTHPLLDRVPPEVVQAEVSWSVQGLTREIGGTLPIFAYPGGHFDDTTTRILANEGIELAFTTRGGVNDLRRACDPLRLRRIHVGARTTRSVLRAQLLGIKPLCVRGRQSV